MDNHAKEEEAEVFSVLPNNERGVVLYEDKFMAPEAAALLQRLLEEEEDLVQPEEVVVFGKKWTITARQTAFFNKPDVAYRYGGTTRWGRTFGDGVLGAEIERLRARLSDKFNCDFNTCIVTRYDPEGKLGWHADKEAGLVPASPISGVSLGAVRPISFKPKDKGNPNTIMINPVPGSLFTMFPPTQDHWLHSVPARKKTTGWRWSLTFRCQET